MKKYFIAIRIVIFFLFLVMLVGCAGLPTGRRVTQAPIQQSVNEEKAIEIARDFLAKQKWANSYLPETAEARDTGEFWSVAFLHVNWRNQKPSRGLIKVDKATGQPQWVRHN